MSKTKERDFEAYLEEMLHAKGWEAGERAEWNKEKALFPARILAFIERTQGPLWHSMCAQHGAEFGQKLLHSLEIELRIKGTLHVLRHGFKCYGTLFRMAYFKPAHSLNPELVHLYAQNQLTLTRQIPCHNHDACTVDMLFAVNGLPVATCELKNPLTGQTWQHAVRQYQEDRLPDAPLFAFKQRALVHFAADTEEVHMTTRLAGKGTFFLPFNRGSAPGNIVCGSGNPQHPSGYRTGYFWEETLERESFLHILSRFMFIEVQEKKEVAPSGELRLVKKESIIFPRYHQLDATKKLIAASLHEGTGHNYLVQHSAGSGKTKSIAWLAHQLATVHTPQDHKLFDCVIVITDRQVLDRQLQEAIYQIDHAQGLVATIDKDSLQLAEALVDGTSIVVTTLQKFPFVLRRLLHVAGETNAEAPTAETIAQSQKWQQAIASRRYAVIVDEAHSSQSGESAREMKAILGMAAHSAASGGASGGASGPLPSATSQNPLNSAGATGAANAADAANTAEAPDWEDMLNAVAASRTRQKNLSMYAFTATPKGKTLQLFGVPRAGGKEFDPFHLYSMRQAIEEGFILDVLQHYTTYNTFFKLAKKIHEDPELDKRKAAKELVRFLHLHPTNVEQKTAVIVEHFRQHVSNMLAGRAKAMVVTASRASVMQYKRSFDSYIKEKKYSIRTLVAFSGAVQDPLTGKDVTESQINIDPVNGTGIAEGQLPTFFAGPEFQILLVAEKYQTGFDQPLLQAMYVDKRLDSVQAVQTLSRLNRIFPGKKSPFVLDFENRAEDIYAAFKPYYDGTSLQEAAEPEQLIALQHELETMQVYWQSEVEGFAKVFYAPLARQKKADHAALYRFLAPAKDRYATLPEADQTTFTDRLRAYTRLYSFLSQIITYIDLELEKLFVFGQALLPLLPRANSGAVQLAGDVSLEYYRLERQQTTKIDLGNGEMQGVKSPSAVGTGNALMEQLPLSELISLLNEKFGTEFTEEDRLFFEQARQKALNTQEVLELGTVNAEDKFALALAPLLEKIFISLLQRHDGIVTRIFENKDFGNTVNKGLSKVLYRDIQKMQEERV